MFKTFILLSLLLFPFNIFASSVSIVTVVNGKPITSYDLNERIKLFKELSKFSKIKSSNTKIKDEVLTEMIDEIIKITEATKYNISTTKEEREDAKFKMAKFLKLPNSSYSSIIKKLKLNENIINKQIEANVIWMKFIYSVLRANVKLSDTEVDNTINNLGSNKNYTYTIVPFILKTKQDYNKLRSNLKTISSCNDFINFAKANGVDGSGNKIEIEGSSLDKNLLNIIQNLKVNTSSDLTKFNNNLNIFFLCDKQISKVQIDKEAKEQFKISLYHKKLEAYAEKYFEKLKQTAVIEYKN